MATINGTAGSSTLRGTNTGDTINGNGGHDLLLGLSGNDILRGGAGTDTLRGGAGFDTLQGGDGNDWLLGDAGNDLLIGNAGADTFVLGSGMDTVGDWNPSQGDKVNLVAALSAFYDPATDDIADFVRVTRNAGANTSTIAIDANGMEDGRVNFQSVGIVKNATYSSVGQMLNAGTLLTPGGGSASSGGSATATQAPDGSVAHFMEFLGVNIEASTSHPSYRNAGKIINSLNYLNIDNVRVAAEAPIGNRNTAPIYDALARAGIDFDFLMRRDVPAKGDAMLDKYISHFKAFLKDHPGSIKSFEGVNEVLDPAYNISYKGMGGKAAASAFQRTLHAKLDNDSVLDDIPLNNFTVWRSQETARMSGYGDLSNVSDGATMHTYVHTGLLAYHEIPARVAAVKILDRNSPAVMTETGYPTNAQKGNSMASSEEVAAKLTLNMIMNAYKHDLTSVYLYELFDAQAHAPGDNKGNFGLFDHDGSATKAAHAIHNLTTILEKNTGAGPAQPVKYDLTGEDANTHAMALQKSGGTTDLVIWREADIWDHRNAREVNVAAKTVHVDLDRTVDYVDVYDPMNGTARQQHLTNVDELTIQVRDHPIILEIDL
jgi:hypothetical protein